MERQVEKVFQQYWYLAVDQGKTPAKLNLMGIHPRFHKFGRKVQTFSVPTSKIVGLPACKVTRSASRAASRFQWANS